MRNGGMAWIKKSAIRDTLPDIAAGFRIILHTVEIKLCAFDFDAANIVLSLQWILIEPESLAGNILDYIIHSIRAEDVQRITIKMKRNILLSAQSKI